MKCINNKCQYSSSCMTFREGEGEEVSLPGPKFMDECNMFFPNKELDEFVDMMMEEIYLQQGYENTVINY